MTIYFKLSDEQKKVIGSREDKDDVWFAVWGIPPNMEVFSSTHLYEVRYIEVALKLAKLSGQEWWIDNRIKELGDKRVKELLEDVERDVEREVERG